jgi:hypothetical protein
MACEDLISVAVYRVLHVRPPVSISTVIITFAVNAAAIQSSRTPSFYSITAEARHDACRPDTQRTEIVGQACLRHSDELLQRG